MMRSFALLVLILSGCDQSANQASEVAESIVGLWRCESPEPITDLGITTDYVSGIEFKWDGSGTLWTHQKDEFLQSYSIEEAQSQAQFDWSNLGGRIKINVTDYELVSLVADGIDVSAEVKQARENERRSFLTSNSLIMQAEAPDRMTIKTFKLNPFRSSIPESRWIKDTTIHCSPTATAPEEFL